MSRRALVFPSDSASSLRCGGSRRFIRPPATPVACSRAAREAGFPSGSASSLRCGGCRRFIRPPATPVACSRAAREAGFTLIEVLASLLLFAMGAMAVVGLIHYGQRSAAKVQADATAWATALSVLKDPMPLGAEADRATGTLAPWTWSLGGSTWTATDGSGQAAWAYSTWDLRQPGDQLVADMGAPVANNPALFPAGGAPATGCARGWLNGYYVERREQSRGGDRIDEWTRIVEVRVDVYWAGYGAGEDRPLATLVDRVVRRGGL